MTDSPAPARRPRAREQYRPDIDLIAEIGSQVSSEPDGIETPKIATPEPSTESEPSPPRYEVGYKKPPKTNQFQPGKSGNPKGRPKRLKSLSTVVREQLDKTISIRIGGKEVKLTVREALVKRWLDKALQGDPKAMVNLIKFDRQGPSENEDEALLASAPLSAEERALLTGFIADKLAGQEDNQ